MNDTNTIIDAESRYLVQTYVRPGMVLSHGEGAYLWDCDGNRYLDFAAGIAVVALGHADPEWAAAVSAQAGRLAHVSNLFHTAPHVELARRLVEHSFADRVFFCNSGSEANEAALKFARKAARAAGHEEKTAIVAFSGSFHGRTMGALAATYKEAYRAPFAPLVPGVTFAPFNDVAAAQAAIGPETCAVLVEPVQGEGGVNPATAEFLQALRAACDEHGALLIFDEVQCGLGRTGTLWAHEGYRRGAGYDDPGQAAGQRPAHRRRAGHRGSGLRAAAGRPRQHLWRRPARLRRRRRRLRPRQPAGLPG
jgi:acetylornithine/N-succinyldiaminopimelate aminotransferase